MNSRTPLAYALGYRIISIATVEPVKTLPKRSYISCIGKLVNSNFLLVLPTRLLGLATIHFFLAYYNQSIILFLNANTLKSNDSTSTQISH